MKRLIAEDYRPLWDYTKGLPVRGEVQAFDMLWMESLCSIRMVDLELKSPSSIC